MGIFNPSTSNRSYYECHECGHRARASQMPGSCPRCGGRVKNIAVAQE